MTGTGKKIYSKIIYSFPIILLFFLSFTGFDLSFYLFNTNLSFNFIYLVIFYWILKQPDTLGYGLVFFAGIINDVVQNLPIGISSINFLLLCSIAAFVRTRTLLPNLIYDWIIFLIAILIVSSVNYTILTLVFNSPIKYGILMSNSFITFMVYPIFSKIFYEIYLFSLRQENAE